MGDTVSLYKSDSGSDSSNAATAKGDAPITRRALSFVEGGRRRHTHYTTAIITVDFTVDASLEGVSSKARCKVHGC